MKTVLAALVVTTALSTVASAAEDEAREVAKTMAVLAAPSFSERESTEKRFSFIIPALVERGSDIDKPMQVADMPVTTSKFLDDRGFGDEESLFQTSVNMHRLTAEVAPYAVNDGASLKCTEIWAMYIQSRENGTTSAEAMSGVAAVAKALYGLAK
ncbi:MAG: hypothetical protein OXC63_00805 [Aestuariivita sp.]|nr:hypothetical protein [Aestuariivita sp.]MCY4346447.1 hypothetical protein [Aestuariivita sp.]